MIADCFDTAAAKGPRHSHRHRRQAIDIGNHLEIWIHTRKLFLPSDFLHPKRFQDYEDAETDGLDSKSL